jgi:ribulose-phosphate 3-epimerase
MTMKNIKFSASMMCADYGHLEDEVRSLEAGGIDGFHIDIMDGNFVYNFGMGIHDLRYIAQVATVPIECHLMINTPIRFVKMFAKLGVNVLYVHPESEPHTYATIHRVSELGMSPAIVLSPDRPIEYISEFLPVVKRVLVMGVTPGDAGQAYLPHIEPKLRKLLALRDEYGFEVWWDGHASPENVSKFAPLGVDGFVLGTATLFGKNRPYKEIIGELRGDNA